MMFFKKFASLWVHLICLSFAIYFRPDPGTSLLKGIKGGTEDPDGNDITRYEMRLLLLLAVSILFFVLDTASR